MHLLAPRVQQWLQNTKLTVTDIDAALETSAVDYVFGRLGTLYVTTGWTNDTNTPSLVQDILSMYIASWLYRRSYAEVVQDQPVDFPVWLEYRADCMIDMILTGAIEFDNPITATNTPVFWPDATTGMVQQYDDRGDVIGWDQYSEGIKFRMGARY